VRDAVLLLAGDMADRVCQRNRLKLA
jgi:hypothetical protein